eukprot:765380-Hanusia_phi.AAC.3
MVSAARRTCTGNLSACESQAQPADPAAHSDLESSCLSWALATPCQVHIPKKFERGAAPACATAATEAGGASVRGACSAPQGSPRGE